MITVNEILSLTLFKKFNVLSGKEYLNNTVTTAVILEYESSRIQFSGYCYGYFVLASYFFASSCPELVNNSLKRLIQKHVSGIAIKMMPDEKLPDDLIQLAKEEHVPLLSFYDEFMEDLIININESMKTRAQYIIHEEKMNLIMSGKNDEEKVRQLALEINPDFKNKIICVNLISKTPADNLLVHTFFDKIMYHSSQFETDSSYTFVKTGQDIVLVCSFNQEEADEIHPLPYIKSVLQQNGFSENSFILGYSPNPVDLGGMKDSVYKAKIASYVAQFQGRDNLSYTYVGVYKYIIVLLQNDIMRQEILNKISVLEEYDRLHEANLLRTLMSYVKNNGDYAQTSKECYQHTNTIRYRIKKAEDLLDLEESTADEEIFMLIRCYHMMGILK
ncbi:MAG: PucR family transcriptional regulator ligand-binding domain-containing protein [Treponema sp.]|nr:PucR family transcriptional regulator ligand-binding domain-containing protein [Treponema sp.]